MNKPASKEPSMDEILSSIRQIIADDETSDEPIQPEEELIQEITADEAAAVEDLTADITAPAGETPVAAALSEMVDAEPEIDEEAPLALSPEQMLDAQVPAPEMVAEEPANEEPLALGLDQMIEAGEQVLQAEAEAAMEAEATKAAPSPEEFSAEFGDDVPDEVAQVVPGDIEFVGDDEPEDETDLSAMLGDDTPEEAPMVEEVEFAVEEPAQEIDLDEATNHMDLSAIEDVAPMTEDYAADTTSALPDPHLSDDIADQLLEPTTQAAASSAFSKLDALTLSSNGQTVEDLIREMLRPMLKGWLDENLPGVVEKLVQREIERVSRGKR